MKSITSVRRVVVGLLGTCAVSLAGAQALAVTVGAGTGIPHEAVDTAGQPRLNVDQSFTQVLAPGIYVASDWVFAAGQSGSVTPFLATSTGADSYQVQAIGNVVAVAGAGNGAATFGGSNTFVVTAPTTIFAGITSPTTQNPIRLDNNTIGTSTDHDNSPSPIANPGNPIAGFSNPNLSRTYAFAVEVDTRPSPFRVGADIAVPHDALDTDNGPRMNIDKSSAITLAPGTYAVNDFSYSAGRAGLVTPFLAVLNGGQYEVIFQGDTVTTGAGNTNATVLFDGDRFFTLLNETTVYAGITNPSGSNPIYLDNGAGQTDHDGSAIVPLTGVGTVIPTAGISNPNLGRQYAFSIGISAVPEPATATFALLTAASLVMRRRRMI